MRRFVLFTTLSLLVFPAGAIAQQDSSGSGVSPYYAPMQPPAGAAAPAPDGDANMPMPPPDDQPGMGPPPPDDQAGMPPPPLPPGLQPPADDGEAGVGRHGAGHGPGGDMMEKWQRRFDAANTTRDGHLTLEQARAAGMRPIVEHFSAIDTQNRGYVTFNELMAWHLDQQAQQMQRRAAALRAQGGG